LIVRLGTVGVSIIVVRTSLWPTTIHIRRSGKYRYMCPQVRGVVVDFEAPSEIDGGEQKESRIVAFGSEELGRCLAPLE